MLIPYQIYDLQILFIWVLVSLLAPCGKWTFAEAGQARKDLTGAGTPGEKWAWPQGWGKCKERWRPEATGVHYLFQKAAPLLAFGSFGAEYLKSLNCPC